MSSRSAALRAPSRIVAAFTGMLLVSALLTVITTTSSEAAIDPCGSSGNKISCENSKPGTPQSEWDVEGAGDDDIQGFATDISVNVGSRVDFKIDTTASAYSVTIYRTGYYDGDGARQIATVTPSATLPQRQPQCITDVSTEMYDCGNWGVSASWNVPSTAVSGVYIAKLRRADTGGTSHITFIVRDDSSTSAIVAQTSDPTWHAYNAYGGSNFYHGANNGRSYKLSYNRPFATRAGVEARDFYFGAEYPLVRFMEKNGYDVSYIAGVDTDRNGALLKKHKTFVSMGHDEYWSKGQRANVEAARDAGVNLAFLSGNEVYWKTRYEASADASHTAYRTLTSYKETWANEKIDPTAEWTGTWRDPRFAPKDKGGGMPENGLTGTAYMSNFTDLPVTVSAAEGKLRLWRNSGLQSMAAGSTAALAAHTVGYESDEDLDNGSRPQGLIRLSTTTGATPQYLQDFGNVVEPGTTTHHLTMYRAPSGALVFSAGSIQWSWGLDATHDGDGAAADRRIQQAQVNLFADMGAQPTTLDTALAAATKTTDTAKPTATINTPAASASIANGTKVTATGTATDSGGVVAGVEVSTDEGNTWHPATGTSSWTYSYTQHGSGPTTLRARAIDDSANIGTAVSRPLTVGCACTVFGTEVPESPSANDPDPVELGLRFSPTVDGFISGVRFYKGTGNTGTHTGSLWSTTGQKLATVTFSGESATGWQTATFASAVPVTKGQAYVVSYTAPNGHYAAAPDAFSTVGLDATPLSVAGGYGATPAGVFGNAGLFPDTSYRNTSYYVDPVFTTTDTTPLTVTSQWPLADSTSVPRGSKITATFSKPATGATLTLKDANGATVAGSTSYDTASRTVTFTPSSPLNGFVRHTATAGGTDAQGAAVTTGRTWSFTTARPTPAPGVCPCSIFDDEVVPTQLQDGERSAVTLGVRFASDTAGTITGVRFYKGPNNTGTHTGALWSAAGTKLAEGTFTGESSSGWQTLTFSQPVAIAKDTEYVASYRAPAGAYSATPGGLGSPIVKAPLRTPVNGGSYTYGTGFPDARSSASYLVDVVFERPAPEIAISAQDPPAGAVDVPRSTDVNVWFTEPIRPGATLAVTQGGTAVAGTTTLSTDAT
ncbi:MAG: N,N-dimethylformamidase beta subunit family domain-containing protein, partial [Aeromicrobium sp.]